MLKRKKIGSIGAHMVKQEAERRGYIIEELHEEENIFFIKKGGKKVLFKGIDGGIESKLGRYLTSNKDLTHLILKQHKINFPKYILAKTNEKVDEKEINKLGYPLITKPLDESVGKGVVINIENKDKLEAAMKYSFSFGKTIMIQNFIEGNNLRVFTIKNKVIAALEWIRHHITGDGKSTIKELIELENKNPRRGGRILTSILPIIKIDEELDLFFKTQYGYSLDSKPKNGEIIFLKGNGYSKTIDITDTLPIEVRKVCEKINKIFKLKIAGIDIIYNKESKKYRILEVNSQPGIKSHHLPMEGKGRNVAGAILDLYFK